jgi:surface antigen
MKEKRRLYLALIYAANVFIYVFLAVNLNRGNYPFLAAVKTIKTEAKRVATIAKPIAIAKIEKKSSGIIDPPKENHFPWGQCTWYVATKRNVPWNGNAIDWYKNAQFFGRKVGKSPVKGSIVVINSGPYGHVGYVESVSGVYFVFSESNNPVLGKITIKSLKLSDPTIIGFIY